MFIVRRDSEIDVDWSTADVDGGSMNVSLVYIKARWRKISLITTFVRFIFADARVQIATPEVQTFRSQLRMEGKW